jgi:LuxR family maltose regulon positive regulatory protein
MPTLERWLLRLESEADLMAGRPELVESRYGAPDRRPTLTFPERILLARAAFAGHDLHRAEALLAGPGAMMAETVASVEAGVLTALVADAAGQGLRSADVLAQSVALAAREGIRRPFVMWAPSKLSGLLRQQNLLSGEHASFITDVLRLMRPAGAPRTVSHPAHELSDRELQVLRYLPTMLTAAEIAGELGVSVNTVKAHMRSIYRKLEVDRRRQAVVRAQKQGII